ncbi:MAG: 50S ribosomal protein L19 [Planctomycetota bacterium]
MDFISRLERTFGKESVPQFRVGDTVDVHYKIKEGDRERIQLFGGVVIAVKGSGARKMLIVRRIVQGEGVERTFPVESPRVADIVVKRHARVRRAKLYYLRGRTGKATRLEETFDRAASDGLGGTTKSNTKKAKSAAPASANK